MRSWSNEDIAFIMENNQKRGDLKAIARYVYDVNPEILYSVIRYYKKSGMRDKKDRGIPVKPPRPENLFTDLEAAREEAQWRADQDRTPVNRRSYVISMYKDMYWVRSLNAIHSGNKDYIERFKPGKVRYDLQMAH